MSSLNDLQVKVGTRKVPRCRPAGWAKLVDPKHLDGHWHELEGSEEIYPSLGSLYQAVADNNRARRTGTDFELGYVAVEDPNDPDNVIFRICVRWNP